MEKIFETIIRKNTSEKMFETITRNTTIGRKY